jgi:hypothetical protein
MDPQAMLLALLGGIGGSFYNGRQHFAQRRCHEWMPDPHNDAHELRTDALPLAHVLGMQSCWPPQP